MTEFKYDPTNKFFVKNMPASADWIQLAIKEQSIKRGWNRDQAWLALSLFKEVGELWQAIEHLGHSDPKKRTTLNDVSKEYSDTLYFLDQLMDVSAPSISLDAAIKCVYDHNDANKKKTLINGKIVER